MIIRPIRKIHRKKRRRNRDAFFSYHTIHGLFLHVSVLVHDSLDVGGGETAINLAVDQSNGGKTAGTDATQRSEGEETGFPLMLRNQSFTQRTERP